MTPSVEQVAPADRRAVVEHRHLVAGVRGRPRTAPHSRPAAAGSLNRVNGAVGQPLTEPGAAARRGERGATLVRRPGARAPGQVDQEVGDRGRRQHRVVTPRREIDRARVPSPADRPGWHRPRRRRHRRSPRSTARPTPSGAGRRTSRSPPASGGLHPAQPEPGGGPQVGGGHLVPGESVQDPVAGPGAPSNAAPASRAVGEDVESGWHRGLVEVEVAAGSPWASISGCASCARPARAAASRPPARPRPPRRPTAPSRPTPPMRPPCRPRRRLNATTNQDSGPGRARWW